MPGIVGIIKINQFGGDERLDQQIDRMRYSLSHLPMYEYKSKIYPQAAFASISMNGSSRLIECRYRGRQYLVLIDGHIYQIGDTKIPTDEQIFAEKLLDVTIPGKNFDLTMVKGNYSIGIYQADDQKFLLFNDIIGPRRMYYAQVKNTLYFAPEIKAICSSDGFQRRIDWKGVSDLLNFGYLLGEDTLFEGIRSLASASSLELSAQEPYQVSINKYWTPIYTESQTDQQAAAKQCYGLLESSIAEKLSPNGETLSPISGGLDSRLILGVLNDSLKVPDILPVTYGQSFSNEYKNARIVCQALAMDNHKLVHITPERLCDKYLLAVWLSEGMIPMTNCHLLLLPEILGNSHNRVLNGIYGGPTNYAAEYFAARHLEREFTYDNKVVDIQNVISISSKVYNRILATKFIPSSKEQGIESISSELKKFCNVSKRFCNQRDAFFIENRMRRCINQSSLYRFFWDEHLPLSNYNLYYNYLDVSAEIKIERKLLRSILIQFHPDLSKIADANTGLNLLSKPSSIYQKKRELTRKLKYYITKASGGRFNFYDRTTYAHYGKWFQTHRNTYERWNNFLFGDAFQSLGLVDNEELEKLMKETRSNGFGFHHISRLTTLAMWYELFIEEKDISSVQKKLLKLF